MTSSGREHGAGLIVEFRGRLWITSLDGKLIGPARDGGWRVVELRKGEEPEVVRGLPVSVLRAAWGVTWAQLEAMTAQFFPSGKPAQIKRPRDHLSAADERELRRRARVIGGWEGR